MERTLEQMPLYLTFSNEKLPVRTESLRNDFPEVFMCFCLFFLDLITYLPLVINFL
jgi:hypothetical protein